MRQAEENESRTAKMAAALRASASDRPNAICDDPWAKRLAGEDGAELAKAGIARAPEMELGVALRTAFLDEIVLGWVGTQVVLLGAGLDTRAARFARPGLRFFEVDHPATQAYKKSAIARLDDYPKGASTFVTCDFEHDDFAALLPKAGFDKNQKTLIFWEGVTAYLTHEAVDATLRCAASLLNPLGKLVLDYLGPMPRSDQAAAVAATVAEPFLFTPADIRPIANKAGFTHVEITSMLDLHAKHAPQAEVAPMYKRWFMATLGTSAPLG